MKERPILFSAPMVNAILSGKKTQTRRIVKNSKAFDEWEKTIDDAYGSIVADDAGSAAFLVAGDHGYTDWVNCPYGKRGDRLYVKETYGILKGNGIRIVYRADGTPMTCGGTEPVTNMKWQSSLFMHRHQSRITLDITNIRVERLRDITEADIIAEGCTVDIAAKATGVPWSDLPTLHHGWQALWEHINGAESWERDPWVWVVEFKRIEAQERAA